MHDSIDCAPAYAYELLFFFHAPPTPALSTLSLHDALPILHRLLDCLDRTPVHHLDRGREDSSGDDLRDGLARPVRVDRKSTRLNSSHVSISYAVFCLKKKNTHRIFFTPRRTRLVLAAVSGR